MGASYRDRVMVSFYLGRHEWDLVVWTAQQRKCSQAEVWRALIAYALDSPVEQIFADREEVSE